MQNTQKHIHIVGICGVATSALAIAFHKKGWYVTGSDKGFYPPVSTALEEAGISFYAGWHPEKIARIATDGSMILPDLVIVANASGTQNPETAWASEHNVMTKSDPEVRGGYFAKKNSIVCVGTWGKTSSTALLSHILTEASMDPSYVMGGLSRSTDAAHLGDSEWSIVEGDEYKSSPTDNRPKFAHLHATHLLLSAVSWDHADIYPTEVSYLAVFEKLLAEIPKNGVILACNDQPDVLSMVNRTKISSPIIWYGKKDADYTYGDVTQSMDGLMFLITDTRNKKSYKITSSMIGLYQAENITGCFAMACQIGISPEKIVEAIASFKGLKRRLEKRLDGGISGITVFDDIAHSPEKASSVLFNIRSIYPKKIIAMFEPNIGGRQKESLPKYNNAFKDADLVIIPRLSKLKIGLTVPLEGSDLAAYISKTHPNCIHIADDNMLVKKITETAQPGDVIVFLGSHGFRGMIEEVVKTLEK